ncbi:SDR family oxidoreductase [Flagellimonas meridianipacifica]|uniref:Nucleoside-diphosphate-sugar epimerase n=1 Tax=Flagellimonas meridianipacifica TaxID=1080225 RepID=A0A2T0MI63_9FLAO|nr:SDR family oxidoreductase [Allomuricauda pacifica]PRX57268.1 nucleoside-diphosphate-sugar epimerase [Allomuricauda pacifica]
MNKSVGVLGCGWLGLPLAQKLVELGYKVFGTTTSASKMELLKQSGIEPYQIALYPDSIEGEIKDFLDNVDVLVINVPPRLRKSNAESYVEKIKLLHSKLMDSSVEHIVFASSTSVYGNIAGEITEDATPQPLTESGKQLLVCEDLLKKDQRFKTTIIRFGGLIGPNRHPVTMLSKKQGLTNGNDPVNLIHLDDCIHIIHTIIKNEYWDETFNAVYPLHPTKKEYYTQEAIKRNLPKPGYEAITSKSIRGIVKSRNFINKSHKFYTSIVS